MAPRQLLSDHCSGAGHIKWFSHVVNINEATRSIRYERKVVMQQTFLHAVIWFLISRPILPSLTVPSEAFTSIGCDHHHVNTSTLISHSTIYFAKHHNGSGCPWFSDDCEWTSEKRRWEPTLVHSSDSKGHAADYTGTQMWRLNVMRKTKPITWSLTCFPPAAVSWKTCVSDCIPQVSPGSMSALTATPRANFK